MIAAWFSALDSSRRALTVILLAVCAATLPLYAAGLWKLTASERVASADTSLPEVMSDVSAPDAAAPTPEPTARSQPAPAFYAQPAPPPPVVAPAAPPVVAPAPGAQPKPNPPARGREHEKQKRGEH